MQFRTGDINLFAACMALGIPPDPIEPAAVYQNDDGKDYVSFTLDHQSLCGMHSTREMMGAWGMRAAFERVSAPPVPCLNAILDNGTRRSPKGRLD